MSEEFYVPSAPVDVPPEQPLLAEGDKALKDVTFRVNALGFKTSQKGREYWNLAAAPQGEYRGRATVYQTIFPPKKEDYALAQSKPEAVGQSAEEIKAWESAKRNVREFNYACSALGLNLAALGDIFAKKGPEAAKEALEKKFKELQGFVFHAGAFGRNGTDQDGNPRFEINIRWHNPLNGAGGKK